ncbi:hypothetical protein PACTADRAFT_1461 [Pachysolen tannophilus NRRL Y-2460]|uniref:NADH dehydrogenase [ubiquinone] 1 beta subcomplex subunit 2 n=1 Tax=Pachysolen tannophilus NRRL Y-2460 TaxID=669874 RepID=A0A1E4TYR0_PACTA|nr:hypothetical protein PACTADRAFT_1461 [Pachysolen tannophilus NRRL Y-2460]
MSSGSHAVKYIKHAPPPLPKVPIGYQIAAKALGATMWFWIFYRAKQDYKIWFGLKHPWEH